MGWGGVGCICVSGKSCACKCVSDAGREEARNQCLKEKHGGKEETLSEIIDQRSASGSPQNHHGQLGRPGRA